MTGTETALTANEVIAKTLADAENLAKKILSVAFAEADQIISDAKKIQDDAYEEAAGARETAQIIIRTAHSEALRISGKAKKDLEDANQVIIPRAILGL